MKRIHFLVIVCLVSAFLSSCLYIPLRSATETKKQTTSETITKAPEGKKDEPIKSNDSEEKTHYTVGETAITKKYKLTVEEFNLIESDSQFIQPDEGNDFVEVVLLIENTTDSKDISVSSLLSFDAYLDGFSIDTSLNALLASKFDAIGGTVAAGKKLRGSLSYELPQDWQELEIYVQLDLIGGTEFKILLNKSDLQL